MAMTQRGHTNLGGGMAVINPFMDNGDFQRIPIEVDNSYNRGYIPPFSLWAPSDYGTSPKYLPFNPPINVTTSTSTTSLEIENKWADYFKVDDEILILDVSELTADLAYRGLSSDDESASVCKTNTLSITAVGVKDSGGTGYVTIGTDVQHTAKCAAGAIGTGDILIYAGHGDDEYDSFLHASRVVIMEQGFNFQDPVDGLAAGNGGVLVESAIYSYTGRIDYNYIEGYTYLNVGGDTSAAMSGQTYFTNYTRFNFENIYRG